MKIVVPYTTLDPATELVLSSHGDVTFERLDAFFTYIELLRELWQERQPVVIVEHDIVPWPGALEELWACPGRWCSYSYRLLGGVGIFHGFGCTKLTGELMQATPTVWDEPGEWHTLDARLFHAAREVGLEPHPHRPPVVHLNPREYP